LPKGLILKVNSSSKTTTTSTTTIPSNRIEERKAHGSSEKQKKIERGGAGGDEGLVTSLSVPTLVVLSAVRSLMVARCRGKKRKFSGGFEMQRGRQVDANREGSRRIEEEGIGFSREAKPTNYSLPSFLRLPPG